MAQERDEEPAAAGGSSSQRPGSSDPKRPATRDQVQIRYILDQFEQGAVGVDPPDWQDEPGRGRYLYRTGSVLVRDRDLVPSGAVWADASCESCVVGERADE